jgi:transcription-repair coupling factor (superfamily II helicase)
MHSLLDQALDGSPLGESIRRLAGDPSTPEVCNFSGIDPPGIPFSVAAIARSLAILRPLSRLWVICPNGRLLDATEAGLPAWDTPAIRIPELENTDAIDALPDPDVAAERLAAIGKIRGLRPETGDRVFIMRDSSLDDRVPTSDALVRDQVDVTTGKCLDRDQFVAELRDQKFEKTFQVAERGQYAVRGGIVDLYPFDSELPIRIEFSDDAVESIRSFDLHTQLAENQLEHVKLLLAAPDEAGDHCLLRNYLTKEDIILSIDCPDTVDAHIRLHTSPAEKCMDLGIFESPLGTFDPGDFVQQEARQRAFISQVEEWRKAGWLVAMSFHSQGEIDRFKELIGGDPIESGTIQDFIAPLARGFTMPGARIAVLSDAEIFGRYRTSRIRRSFGSVHQLRHASASAEIRELSEGDLVVHAEYGIGRFIGLHPDPGNETLEGDTEAGGEVIWIAFADEAKLYVPLDQAHLVSRYIGAGKAAPSLSKLGTARWSKLKANTERAIEDYAARLLSIQAQRETATCHPHPVDTHWQFEFESSFPYRETPDQLRAIEETKRDMERDEPMDRLICGDVGFGKTEVAIRAAFKSVMAGRQVAILVPTTVLAQQHYQTFRERMSDYPVTIELLSRYRSPSQQRQTVRGVAAGSVDIVIGTHRLISKDIGFKNLGLVVIDEEQRFGVQHKERFKEIFRNVDILTLSATPIPRTLYLSLMGVRDMSTIDTPPANRFPVKTVIAPYDERTIKAAINHELHRGGQVFFLHNRVKTIEKVAERIRQICPDATTIVGHGQMEEGTLEEVMHRFISGDAHILVSTTIIESGIDIPNANTIIIDRADRFGLADLYQLRGRVGRSGIRAHAILLLPREFTNAGDARRRIGAIRQYSDLGAGFRIAMRDLEIRGAGNLLGTRQSGHIAAIGFDLYCRLLRESVERLSGKRPIIGLQDTSLRADFLCFSEAEFSRAPTGRVAAFIPATYMAEPKLRIMAYRSLAELHDEKELASLISGWRDRFGIPPEAVENLLNCTRLKLACACIRIQAIEIHARQLRLKRGGRPIQIDGKFPRLRSHHERDCLEEARGIVASLR